MKGSDGVVYELQYVPPCLTQRCGRAGERCLSLPSMRWVTAREKKYDKKHPEQNPRQKVMVPISPAALQSPYDHGFRKYDN